MGAFDHLIPKAPVVAGADPRDFTERYNTQLSPEDEQKFNLWAQANNRVKDSYDYDMRGAYQELMSGQTQQADNGHFTDKFKKPNHPTFSNESQYNGVDGFSGGQWVETPKGTSFAPGQSQSKLWPADELGQYFKQTEPDITLMQPDRMDRIANGSVLPTPPMPAITTARAGAFDHLIPKEPAPAAAPPGRDFLKPQPPPSDVVQQPSMLQRLFSPSPSVPTGRGGVVGDDGMTYDTLPQSTGPSKLVQERATDPELNRFANMERGGANELEIAPVLLNQAFHQTPLTAVYDAFASGGVDRSLANNLTSNAQQPRSGGASAFALAQPTLAARLRDTGMQKSMRFAQEQARDEALAQVVKPASSADSELGRVIAGASSAGSNLMGSLYDPTNFFVPGAGREATAVGTAVKNVLPGFLANAALDPVVQFSRSMAGLQEGGYSPEQTALAGVTGGVITGGMAGGAHALDDFGGWVKARTGRNVGDMSPEETELWRNHWYDAAADAKRRAGLDMEDPDFQRNQIEQNTGVNLPPSQTIRSSKTGTGRGAGLTPEQYRARNQTESELANLFNDEPNIWPRAQVEVGPDGIHIPEGVLPVRDALGQQAHTDTLAPRGMAVDALGQIDPLPPNPADISRLGNLFNQQPDVSVGDVVGHAQASGNQQRMRETAPQREELGLKPETDRDRMARERSEQQTERAFRLAERERERAAANEGKTSDANPMYAGEGAESARMAQDRAAQSSLPNKEREQLRGEFEKAGLADVPEPHMAEAERLMGAGFTRKGAVNRVLRQNPVEAAKPEGAPHERPAETPEPSPVAEPKTPEPAPEPAPAEPAPPAEKAPGGPDDILARAFAPQEKPAAKPGTPNLDHLTPEQQRRATALDHEIATSKAFDPPEETARLQKEYDDLVNSKAPEPAPEAKAAETPAETPAAQGTHPVEVLDTIDRELASTYWNERGDKTSTGADGTVKKGAWLSSNPDIHSLITGYSGMTVEKARNLIARAKSGKGKPLNDRQLALIDDMAAALEARNQRAPREPAPAPKAEPAPAPKAEPAPGPNATDEAVLRQQLERHHPDVRLGPDGPRLHVGKDDAGIPLPLNDAEKARFKAITEEMQALYNNGKKMTRAQENRHADLFEELRDLEREGADRYLGKKPEKAPDLELKGQTEAERAASEKETKAKNDEAAATKKAAEDKAQADKDAKDFKLSGSDSPADKAASHGQGTLLDLGAVPSRIAGPIKAIYKRLFHGDDKSSPADIARDLSHATKALFNQERPTKRGRVADTYRRVMTDTDSSMRSLVKPFKGDIGEQIADQIHVQAGDKGGKGPSFDERQQQQTNPREHEIEKLDDWLSENKLNTPEAQAQIVKLVENPNTPRRGVMGEAAKKVEAFYKEMHQYLKDAGVDVGHVKGYFQRVLDNGEVAGQRSKFLTAAKKAYKQDNPQMTDSQLQKAAEDYWHREVNGDAQKPGSANTASGGGTPSHLKSRVFSKEAAKHLDDFYVKEIPAMLSSYLHRSVQRAETAKSGVMIDGKFQPFGDNFKHWDTITDAMRKQDPEISGVLDEFNKLVGTSMGISDSKLGSGWRKAASFTKTVTTLDSMEKSVLSSMTELLTPSLRASMGEMSDLPTAIKAMGDHAYNAVRAGVAGKKGRSNKLENMFDVAKASGIVGGSGQHSLMAARSSAGDPTSRTQAAILSRFFGRNGLEHLTSYQRATGTGQAMDFLKRLSAPGRQGKAKTERFLGELGIKVEDQPAFTKFVRDLGGKHATVADLKGPMADKYKTAMLRFVDQAIQRPSASTRPAWANEPLGSVAFQLQSFNYAAQKNIINRMLKAAKDKDLTVAERSKMGASYLAHMAAMTGISYGVWEARDKAFSRPDSRQLTPWAKGERAFSGAGGYGKFDALIQALGGGVKYAASPVAALAGASAGNAASLLQTPFDLAGPNNSPNTNTAERKAARTVYQHIAEPLLQAAATPLRNSPVGMGLTAVGIPLAGEKLVNAMLPPKEGNKKELPPIEGTAETIYKKIAGKKKSGW